ncbi:hypothetical protein Mterra_03781 [Calidithermus terrae]|uniref:Uncharacterized protein n=1 Tax=Calidithermus terrae TaxID=1408545 RepID=A0A399DYF9_9DEIN|nr:hypothetical protein Mterra_03781 [Calidithermus terrae]
MVARQGDVEAPLAVHGAAGQHDLAVGLQGQAQAREDIGAAAGGGAAEGGHDRAPRAEGGVGAAVGVQPRQQEVGAVGVDAGHQHLPVGLEGQGVGDAVPPEVHPRHAPRAEGGVGAAVGAEAGHPEAGGGPLEVVEVARHQDLAVGLEGHRLGPLVGVPRDEVGQRLPPRAEGGVRRAGRRVAGHRGVVGELPRAAAVARDHHPAVALQRQGQGEVAAPEVGHRPPAVAEGGVRGAGGRVHGHREDGLAGQAGRGGPDLQAVAPGQRPGGGAEGQGLLHRLVGGDLGEAGGEGEARRRVARPVHQAQPHHPAQAPGGGEGEGQPGRLPRQQGQALRAEGQGQVGLGLGRRGRARFRVAGGEGQGQGRGQGRRAAGRGTRAAFTTRSVEPFAGGASAK